MAGVPPGTPAPVIERLREGFTTALNEPGMRDHIPGPGVMGMGGPGPAERHAFLPREIERWAPVVRASGATPG